MADYDPKQRRRRVEPAADEPAPVDALLDVVEHVSPPDPTPVSSNGATAPVVPVGPPAQSVPPTRPDLSVVPGPPEGGPRQLLVALAAGFGIIVVLWWALRRRRRR